MKHKKLIKDGNWYYTILTWKHPFSSAKLWHKLLGKQRCITRYSSCFSSQFLLIIFLKKMSVFRLKWYSSSSLSKKLSCLTKSLQPSRCHQQKPWANDGLVDPSSLSYNICLQHLTAVTRHHCWVEIESYVVDVKWRKEPAVILIKIHCKLPD